MKKIPSDRKCCGNCGHAKTVGNSLICKNLLRVTPATHKRAEIVTHNLFYNCCVAPNVWCGQWKPLSASAE